MVTDWVKRIEDREALLSHLHILKIQLFDLNLSSHKDLQIMLKPRHLLPVLLLFPSIANADASTDQAKALFSRYVRLGNAFDPAVADLYSDSATVRNTRRFPDGNARVMTLSGKQYKALIRQVMPLAKARNDKDSYSQVTYKRVGAKVRISAQRYSLLKKYTSPFTLVVMPDPKKKWMIVEDYSESRP